MQGYPQSLPTTNTQESQAGQKHVNLVNLQTQKISEVDGFQDGAIVTQPNPEPSPMHQPQVEPSPMQQSISADCRKVTDFTLDDMNETESEPSTKGSVVVHNSVPEPLRTTNLASIRFRKSCYFESTMRWGVKSFQSYNHMLLPQVFSTPEDEYESLRKDVCIWDVACERQIEVLGEDALQLVEILTPRKLGSMKVGEARYAIMTDEDGMVLNDPVVLKIAADCYWFSIADSDMLLWIKGLALGRRLKVKVSELDVSPLAVQGPKSLPLMKDLFGDWVEEIKFYNFRETELDGIPMLLCRSGWSPERGYELFLQDGSRGNELWEKVMAAGQKYGIKPGAPNMIRRLEGGMLVFGSDITPKHNILELGLPLAWSYTEKPDYLGKDAIKSLIDAGGPKQHVVGLEFQACAAEDRNLGPIMKPWDVLTVDEVGNAVVSGHVTSIVFSPFMGAHIAIATLAIECTAGTEVSVDTACGGRRSATVRKLPFMPRTG